MSVLSHLQHCPALPGLKYLLLFPLQEKRVRVFMFRIVWAGVGQVSVPLSLPRHHKGTNLVTVTEFKKKRKKCLLQAIFSHQLSLTSLSSLLSILMYIYLHIIIYKPRLAISFYFTNNCFTTEIDHQRSA